MVNITSLQTEKCIPRNAPVSTDLVLFSHIPKTAGSALKRNIEQNCQDVFSLYAQSHEKGTDLSDWVKKLNKKLSSSESGSRSAVQMVYGHVGFGIHEFFESPSCTYITLLREPAQRVVSHYYRLKQYGSQDSKVAETIRNVDLRTFVLESDKAVADNLQTRFLSGLGWCQVSNTKGWQQLLKESKRNIHEFRVEPGQCDSEMLERAKENLSKYYIFGLQDRFLDSLNLFQKALNWSQIADLKLNVRSKKGREKIDPSTIQLIRERNQLDVELYRYAKKLFDSQLERLC